MAQAEILGLLREREGIWTPTQWIQATLGLNKGSVLSNCRRLEKAGFISWREAYVYDKQRNRNLPRYEWRFR